MSRRLRICSSFILMLVVGCHSLAEPVAVSEPREMVPLEPGIVGFNSPMGALGEPRGSYVSDRMDQALSILPVQALRFPGGTVANYFDWDSETLMEQALERSGKKRLIENQKKMLDKYDGEVPPVDFSSFYAFTEQHGIRRFVVLNMLTSPIEGTIATIDRIKQRHPGRYYWELGNELSQDAYRKGAFATDSFDATVYAGLASVVAAHIEKHYPEDRIGIVAGQLIEGRVPEVARLQTLQESRSDWDRAAAAVEHIDAAIFHPYILVSDPFLGRVISRAGSGPRQLQGLDVSAEARWRWMFACAQELPGLYVQRLQNRYPGRKIWITEAGLIDNRVEKDPARQQDMSRVLFNVAYFISWLEEYPVWESFLYHGLFSGRGHMTAFGPDMRWNANTVAYAFLERLLRGGRAVAALDISGVPVYRGIGFFADTPVRALTGAWVSKDDGDSILLVNTGPRPVDVRLPFDEMSTITVGGVPDAGMDDADFEDESIFRRVSGQRGVIQAPAYSVVLIDET